MEKNEKELKDNNEMSENENPTTSESTQDTPKKNNLIYLLLSIIIIAGLVLGISKIVKSCQNRNDNDYYYEEPEGEVVSYDRGKINLVSPFTQDVLVKDIEWSNGYGSSKDSIVLFAKNGKRGYCNVLSNKIIVEPTTYTKAWIFSEGLAGVEKDGYIGFVNTDGKVAINFKYSYRGNPLTEFVFHDGHCVVADSSNKIGVINNKGRWVIKPLYDNIETTKEYAIVYTKGDFKKQIDFNGNVLNDGIIDDIYDIYYDVNYTDVSTGEPSEGRMKIENFFEYKVENYSGLMNSRGQFITPPIYTDITGISPTLFKATLQDYISIVLIDQNGNVISGRTAKK
ncbi:MAG: WG repeat-containing protein [Bacteroidales bacterium]|nr:WG repeat-containing protein [Bacteroidales bacterium]